MILSHRVVLALLDRKNRDIPARLRVGGKFEVPGGKVNRRLERFAALAARLARLGSRDIPLPGRLHRLDLPALPQGGDEAVAWAGTGPAGGSGPQEPASAGLRVARRAMAAAQAPSRALSVAAAETRIRAGHPAAVVAGRERLRLRKPSPDVRMAVPQARGAALPASQPRSAVAVVQAAAAAGSRGRTASVQQGRALKVLSAKLPLTAASTVAGNDGSAPSGIPRPASGQRAMSAGRSGSNGATALDVMHMAQVKAAQPAAMPAGAASPAAGGFALPPAPGAVSPEAPVPGSTSGAWQGLAVLQRGVVSPPRAVSSQDILRRQVVPPTGMPNRPAAAPADRTMQDRGGSQRTDRSPASSEGGFGADAGRMMMVSLAGDVVIDGRRLGQVAASSQASRASLPAHGPSRVNLRAVPIHPGMQIPQ